MRSNISLGTDTQQQNAATRRMLRAGQLRRYLAVVALAVASSALHLASKFDLFVPNGTDQTRR